jgi:multiple sugar transport system ATP-binding protein
MRKGELQQVADPQTLYDKPVNLFVGGFIGSPAMNMLEATLERSNGGMSAKIGSQAIDLQGETLDAHPELKAFEGRTVVLGIRPEDLEDAALAADAPAGHRLKGTVELTEALGSEIMVHFAMDAKPAVTDDVLELAEDSGDDRAPDAKAGDHATLVGRFGARSRVRSGGDVDVVVDTRALHFFDPETGLGIYDSNATKGAA